jgi:hypothetical protein
VIRFFAALTAVVVSAYSAHTVAGWSGVTIIVGLVVYVEAAFGHVRLEMDS